MLGAETPPGRVEEALPLHEGALDGCLGSGQLGRDGCGLSLVPAPCFCLKGAGRSCSTGPSALPCPSPSGWRMALPRAQQGPRLHPLPSQRAVTTPTQEGASPPVLTKLNYPLFQPHYRGGKWLPRGMTSVTRCSQEARTETQEGRPRRAAQGVLGEGCEGPGIWCLQAPSTSTV